VVRTLTWRAFIDVLVESARTTSMLFMIMIGALLFANFINYTGMPSDLKSFVTQFELHPSMVVVAICAVYLVLGTAMEELSMILLTVPLLFPVVMALGYDPVWFGIIVVLVVQIGLISPPVGMNIFVVKSLLPHLPLTTVFRGVWPFTVALVVMLALVVAFPQLATWLPGQMK
jgi:C4-dicarboxylate transporter, DctM subunit